ncbi:MAG: asparagine synthase (glutamine-hydrolyzing) [Flavobacteriales bacterium]|nr:MAG: asparagine synthase (glutamine-hydrolyzing) [Flavobacteriales bacterium]
MCGIAGSYHLGSGRPPVDDRIGEALACLAHRGPDDEGTYRKGNAVLGHRRLSIIDTSAAGHQPFTDDGGRYTIAFNGEVFNFQELRAQLEAAGHAFRSRTDTEVVLRLFAVKGEAFLHELNGFFALAIHDAEKDELLLARDRFGVKPLWWSEQDGLLRFASELRALKALGARGEPDRHSLQQYFTYHYIPAPWSILKGVRKLEPGELLRATAAGTRRERWYDLPEAARRTPLPPDPVAQLRELLEDAVRMRLISDVPIGTFLSGGLDSSIVSALAARHQRGLRTFSIGYADDPYFDETRYAEEVARRIGSEHTTFKLTRDDLAAAYTDLLAAIDEPFADSSALPSFILCRETRKQVTVALSGDGADEVFGGYRKHQAELHLAKPGPLEKAVIALGPLWRRLPRSRNNPITDAFRRLERFANAASGHREQRWLSLASFDSDGDAGALVPRAAHPMELDDRDLGMTQGMAQMPGLNGYLLADVRTVLPNDMLHKVDLTSMAHALEVRTPFLDRRVVELAFALPAELKLRPGVGKAILREAFGGLLPASVLERGKQGFEVPLRDLLLGPLAPWQDRLLTRDLVESAGLRWEAVEPIRRRLRSARPGQAQATVHALLVFLSWWKTHGR